MCLPAGGFAQLPLLSESSAFKAAALTGKLEPQTGDRQRRGEEGEENIEMESAVHGHLTLPFSSVDNILVLDIVSIFSPFLSPLLTMQPCLLGSEMLSLLGHTCSRLLALRIVLGYICILF